MKTMTLDIGGTAIKSAIYENGHLHCIQEHPTEASHGGQHVVHNVLQIISTYQKKYSFEKIGISTTGQVNSAKGYIIYANNNIPGYTGTPVKSIIETMFHVPTFVENDVNSAAIGEAFFGAGKDETDFVCLTYGTGIGGAMFLNNTLYSGSTYSAGEFGAIITHPEHRHPETDFFSGCYEKYASTTALIDTAQHLDPTLTTGRLLFEQLHKPAVCRIIDHWILEIIYGLTTIIHMLNPSSIILGGGIMEQPYILSKIQDLLYKHLMPSYRHVKIKRAALGNQAGLLGAAILDQASICKKSP